MKYQIYTTSSPLPWIEHYNAERNTWLVRWQGKQADEIVEVIVEGEPTPERIKHEVIEWHNQQIDQRILSGFRFEGKVVWLCRENQFNYKVAYDLAVQTKGASLPVTFKFGTSEEPVYRTFETLPDLQAFYMASVQYVQSVLSEGWQTKDQIDWSVYENRL